MSGLLWKTSDHLENLNRGKIHIELDELSSVIQKATNEKKFNVRLTNPNLKRCYEILECTGTDCPCYGKEAMRCWQEAETCCTGEVQERGVQKLWSCTDCLVFKEVTSDPIYKIGEYFNNMMYILELENKELEEAYSKLEATQAKMLQKEKMSAIGQIAAGVAHEINNPIGFISSNLGTLGKFVNRFTEFIHIQSEIVENHATSSAAEDLKEKRKALKLDYILEDTKELIQESLEGADRVKKIVQGLKSFSRMDQAEHKLTDINECLESTISLIWNELKYKTTLKKEYGELPLSKCFPQQLSQVFINLLINAAQAIEKQGEITIKTTQENGFIKISISDTGCGIPEEKLMKIFEPFFTTKDIGTGTGLGLSITYDIVKKHNGDIIVRSEVGIGTTFIVSLPIVEER